MASGGGDWKGDRAVPPDYRYKKKKPFSRGLSSDRYGLEPSNVQDEEEQPVRPSFQRDRYSTHSSWASKPVKERLSSDRYGLEPSNVQDEEEQPVRPSFQRDRYSTHSSWASKLVKERLSSDRYGLEPSNVQDQEKPVRPSFQRDRYSTHSSWASKPVKERLSSDRYGLEPSNVQDEEEKPVRSSFQRDRYSTHSSWASKPVKERDSTLVLTPRSRSSKLRERQDEFRNEVSAVLPKSHSFNLGVGTDPRQQSARWNKGDMENERAGGSYKRFERKHPQHPLGSALADNDQSVGASKHFSEFRANSGFQPREEPRRRGAGRYGERFHSSDHSEGRDFQRKDDQTQAQRRGTGRFYREQDGTHKTQVQDRDKSWFENVQSFSFNEIMSLQKLPPERLVSDLYSKIKKFQGTLQRRPMLDKPGIMDAIITILSKIADTISSSNPKTSQILGEVLSERCATFQLRLKMYISQDLLQPQASHTAYKYKSAGSSTEAKVQTISKLFRDLLRSLPGSSWSCLPIDELQNAVEELVSNGTIGESCCECLQDILALRDSAREQHSKQLKQSKAEDGGWDNSEYKEVQILPEWKEVCTHKKPARLRKNIISGSYSDWLHYYDVQFRLLREDFIAPLRNGVCDYLNGTRGRRLKNVRIYENVLIKEPVFSPTGLCYKIKLDFSHMRHRCNWGHSKRLLHGSLLCLSPVKDNFTHDIYFATVTDRDPKKLEDGELEIMFQGQAEILSFSCKDTAFIVVESCAYFEASRHILRSLQTAAAEIETMPFKAYLVAGDCSAVDQPQYIEDNTNPYNLSFLLTEEEKSLRVASSEPEVYDTLLEQFRSSIYGSRYKPTVSKKECFLVHQPTNFSQWPSCDQTELDKSQMEGLQMALTQEIAVIQGPPGTGKTYIGLKIVEALLLNKKIWKTDGGKSPILVMCFTNHALDQFLEGILSCPLYKDSETANMNIVRIGGRSQSEKLAGLNLHQKRINVFLPVDVRNEKFSAESNVRESSEENSMLIKSYYDTMRNCVHIRLQDLADENNLQNIIQANHHAQLSFYMKSEEQNFLALEIWLCFYHFNNRYLKETHARMVEQKESKPEVAPPEKAPEKVTSKDPENDQSDPAHEDQDKQDESDLIDIVGEATIEQSDRILDDDYQRPAKEIIFSQESGDFKQYLSSLNRHHNSVPLTVTRDGNSEISPRTIPFDKEWANIILELGFAVTPMSEEESSNVHDIHQLSFEDRWRLYHFWRLQYLKRLCEKCEEELVKYNGLCTEQEEARKAADRYVLETAEIIGLTTTGAAKYQHILHQVKPRIVIVEEAAEVLESHIVSALNAGTQHLILIGDHKQLRPKPNEYELAKKYNLDVSLFERLVRNGFPHATLEYQHRMRPEIAQLVKPHIYTVLSNHEAVEAYPNVSGVSTNLFFINHQCDEKEDDNLMSHSNDHEARYLVNLCKYLLQQRYTPQQITILVTYAGQLLAMRKLMPRNEFEGVRVSTVDNFQGEENDIILLSLVRSNSENNVGFLREENRVCVALSRAKQGFYCIGNFTMLRDQVPIWDTIMSDMESKGKLGDGLLLHCSNHPDKNFTAKISLDFAKNSPKGGCLQDCIFRLLCGHVCAQKCHYTDPEHEEYVCRKNCAKKCTEGHPCRKQCYQPCQCMVRMTRTMPMCDHDLEMYCYEDPYEVDCTNPCKQKCPKGHSCPLKCHQTCKPCTTTVSVIMPSCNHQQYIACHQDPRKTLCRADCSQKCKNGHPCPKLCYEECGDCVVSVVKTIPECDHEISLPCHVQPEHKDCTKPCERILPCSHKCSLKCGEDCLSEKCTKQVTVELPDCGHEVKVLCHESQDVSAIFCNKKCERSLPCGHSCDLRCSEPCSTQCKVKVNKVWPCGHKLKRACYQTLTPEKYPCESKCTKKLECGHPCSKKCSQPCDEKCEQKISKVYPCGHKNEVMCSSSPSDSPCKLLCTHILACGHKCGGKCSQCFARHIHEPCGFKIGPIQRFCGHSISLSCNGLTDSHPGKKVFTLACPHKTVNKTCPDVHHTCDKPCEWNCAHFECDKPCSEMCTRPRCDERCQMKLKCGHQCYSLCGEPCLSTCPVCQLKQFRKKLKPTGQFNKAELYYQLACSHIFSVKYLDDYVEKVSKSDCDMQIHPLLCPLRECSLPFSCGYRYGNQAKLLLTYVQDVNTILKSTPFASDSSALPQANLHDDDGVLLQRSLRNTITSENYTEEPIVNGRRPISMRQGDIIKKDSICVYYETMPEISTTLYKLKTLLPRCNEDKYLVLLFTEALSLLEQFQSGDDRILKDLKRFLRFISKTLLKDNQFKLNYQIVTDLSSAFFRIYLDSYISEAESCLADDDDPCLVNAKSYLEKISSSNSPVTKLDFQFHMKAISKLFDVPDDDYKKFLRELDDFRPNIYKGQWWRCTKGHYYCSPPSLLNGIELKCPKCEGYEGSIKIPEQLILQPNTAEAGPIPMKTEDTKQSSEITAKSFQPQAQNLSAPPPPSMYPPPHLGMDPSGLQAPYPGHPQGLHPQGLPGPHPQGIPGPHPQGLPGPHPQGLPGPHPQGLPGPHPQGLPGPHPQGLPGPHPQGLLPQQIPLQGPQGFPQQIPLQGPQGFPGPQEFPLPQQIPFQGPQGYPLPQQIQFPGPQGLPYPGIPLLPQPAPYAQGTFVPPGAVYPGPTHEPVQGQRGFRGKARGREGGWGRGDRGGKGKRWSKSDKKAGTRDTGFDPTFRGGYGRGRRGF